MKRRNFFRRVLGVIVGAMVAPFVAAKQQENDVEHMYEEYHMPNGVNITQSQLCGMVRMFYVNREKSIETSVSEAIKACSHYSLENLRYLNTSTGEWEYRPYNEPEYYVRISKHHIENNRWDIIKRAHDIVNLYPVHEYQ